MKLSELKLILLKDKSCLGNKSTTGAEESADTLEGPRGDCKAYQKCISTIFDNFGGKINQKMVFSNFFFFNIAKIIIVIIIIVSRKERVRGSALVFKLSLTWNDRDSFQCSENSECSQRRYIAQVHKLCYISEIGEGSHTEQTR